MITESRKTITRISSSSKYKFRRSFLNPNKLCSTSFLCFRKGCSGWSHNQRLEFLGDAVVGLIVGDYLYNNFPNKDEGELTKCELQWFVRVV